MYDDLFLWQLTILMGVLPAKAGIQSQKRRDAGSSPVWPVWFFLVPEEYALRLWWRILEGLTDTGDGLFF